MNDTEQEEWRIVPGTFDMYEASNLGRIRSWCVVGATIYSGCRLDIPRIVEPQKLPDGRQIIQVNRENCYIHHLVLEAFVGPRPKGFDTRHLDGDNTNNRLGNIKYGTKKENAADKVLHGTSPRNRGHFLTPDVVRAIRADTRKYREIAADIGLSMSMISGIKNGYRWAYLP